MPASNHTLLGTVEAVQYTGTNAAELQTVIGNSWSVFTNTVTNVASTCQVGNEMFMNVVHPTDWLVSQPAYSNETPALSAGFSIVQNGVFTRQYSA